MSYPCCSVLGMDGSTDRSARRATELIDELVVGHRSLARAQAWCAALMMEFAETRTVCDRKVIAEREAAGVEARYKAGEFAGLEISMALRESKYAVQRTMVVARRLRADTPDAWDAWLAGDITFDKAERISRTLGRLVRDNSKALLNAVVVDVAVCKTGELLGRWLNQFVARVEPDEQDERIGRSLADRYVSVRPDLDGVSVLSAALSSMDAASIDRVLTAIAAVADPSDTRTMQQRRADALVDVLLGRISNGCHTRWDGVDNNGFEEDGFEDNDFDVERGDGEVAAEGWFGASVSDREPLPDHREGGNDDVPDTTAGAEDSDAVAVPDDVSTETDTTAAEGCASVVGDNAGNATVTYATGAVDDFDLDDDRDADDNGHDDNHRDNHDVDESEADSDTENDVDIDDWDLPASAFRPDPPRGNNRTLIAPPTGAAPDVSASGTPTGVHPCTCGGRPAVPAAGVQIRPVQVNIGVIISAASLLGFTNAPGQLADSPPDPRRHHPRPRRQTRHPVPPPGHRHQRQPAGSHRTRPVPVEEAGPGRHLPQRRLQLRQLPCVRDPRRPRPRRPRHRRTHHCH